MELLETNNEVDAREAQSHLSQLRAAADDPSVRAKATEALAAHDRAIEACRVAMAGIQRSGLLPTEDAIAALRGRRDAAWRLVRRHFVEGHAAATTAADWPDATIPTVAELPALLDRLLREADELTDRRTTEAVRIAEWEGHLDEQARLVAQRDGLVSARDMAQLRLDEALTAWRAAWVPAGVQPLDPAAMREWVRARDAVLSAARTAAEAERQHAVVAALHAALALQLRTVMPGAEASTVADLQQEAARRLKALDASAERYAEAERDAKRTARSLVDARAELAAIDTAQGRWQEDWAPIATRLGLPATSGTEGAAETLALWTAVETKLSNWSDSEGRILAMSDALDAHEAVLAALAGRLGVPVSDGLVTELAGRLDAAQHVRTEQARLTKEHDDLVEAIAAHRGAVVAAEGELDALRRQAGVADEPALAAAVVRAAEHSRLASVIRERTAELHKLDDGKAEAELEAEAAEIDIDEIPGRLAEITARLTELDAERVTVAGQRADVRTTLQHMEAGQDVTGPAQAVQDSLTEIEEASPSLRTAAAGARSPAGRHREIPKEPAGSAAGRGEPFVRRADRRSLRASGAG